VNVLGPIVALNVIGVIDNIYIVRTGTATQCAIFVGHPRWNHGDFGDRSFSDPYVLGDRNYLFVENCDFNGPLNCCFLGAHGGARFVFRHNNSFRGRVFVDGLATVTIPGIANSDGTRGGAIAIIHDNTFGGNTQANVIRIASGIAFIYNNTWGNWGAPASSLLLRYDRSRFVDPAFFSPSGNPWDEFDDPPLYSNLASTGHATGSAAAGTNMPAVWQNNTVTVAGANFPVPNGLVGCVIVRTVNGVPTAEGTRSATGIITSNTDTTLWYGSGAAQGSALRLTATGGAQVPEIFSIYRVRKFFDAPSRIGGPLIDRYALTQPIVPTGGPQQRSVPVYAWNNAQANTFLTFPDANLVEGEYWKMIDPRTDPAWQGEPYAEYTYPHPLRGEEPPA
jgi:hypothetical protein